MHDLSLSRAQSPYTIRWSARRADLERRLLHFPSCQNLIPMRLAHGSVCACRAISLFRLSHREARGRASGSPCPARGPEWIPIGAPARRPPSTSFAARLTFRHPVPSSGALLAAPLRSCSSTAHDVATGPGPETSLTGGSIRWTSVTTQAAIQAVNRGRRVDFGRPPWPSRSDMFSCSRRLRCRGRRQH